MSKEFDIAGRLESLYTAYEALCVLSTGEGEPHHVGSILNIINEQLQKSTNELYQLSRERKGLVVVG